MADYDQDFFELAVGVAGTGCRVPADPALIAAQFLLARALTAAGMTPEQAGADGFISVITVAAPEWTKLARQAWCEIVRDAESWHDGEPSSGAGGSADSNLAAATGWRNGPSAA